MKKLLSLLLLVIALNQAVIVKAQCPPGAFAYQSTYSQCPSGCGVLLLGWPEGVIVNIYGGSPLHIITSALISGTLGGSGTGDAFTCVPCNTPLVYASNVIGATGGCVIATIGVLPVKINNFSAAVAENNTCQFKWTASSETGAVNYTIQKSIDGRNFTDVATVKGLQQPVNNYTYSIPQNAGGSAFYRLKAVEVTGNTVYSETVLVKNQSAFGFSVYPNPALGDFKINLSSRSLPAMVEIINAQGAIVYRQKANEPVYTVSKYLPKGIYAVKVTGSNNESLTQRLIKN